MQVAITCRHGNLRDETQRQIRSKAEKLLTYFERVTQIQVTVDFGKDQVDVEILVDAEHKHDFVGRQHDKDGDVMVAFDAAFHRVEHQIKRYKEKVQDHRRDVAMGNLAGDGADQGEGDEDQE